MLYYLSSFFNREKLKAETTFFSFVINLRQDHWSWIFLLALSPNIENNIHIPSFYSSEIGKWNAITNSLDFGGSSITKSLRFGKDASSETKRNNSGVRLLGQMCGRYRANIVVILTITSLNLFRTTSCLEQNYLTTQIDGGRKERTLYLSSNEKRMSE